MRKLLLLGLAAAIGLAAPVQAQEYPNKVIRFLQGFPPGGNVDLVARVIAAEMQKGLGQNIIVEARPGLAGALAAEAISKAEPDGYTLLVLPSAHPAHGALSKHVRYNVVDDFTWISTVSAYPFVIAVRKDSPFKSLDDLLAAARKKPGDVKYGSAGIGSILHTTSELLAYRTKTRFLHVPYKGEAPALTALLAGDIDFISATTGPLAARIKSGEFRALAVTSTKRWPGFEGIPTVMEQGVPDFEVMSWIGLAGPAKLPKPVVDRLHAELSRAIKTDEVRNRLAALGGDTRPISPAQFQALVKQQYDTWRKLAEVAGLFIK